MQSTDVAPPHSIEAEQHLLGALLIDPGGYDRIGTLASKHFYTERHQLLFAALRRMIEAGLPVDFVTVVEELKRRGELDKVGGSDYLAKLAENTASAFNIGRYAELVRNAAIRRDLTQAANEIAQACQTGALEPREIVEHAEALVLSVLGDELGGEIDLQRQLMQAVDRADEARKANGPLMLRTGFCDLDAKLVGLAPGSLTILAARPAVGKSALALNIAERVAACSPVAFFSLEMDRAELMDRLLAGSANVPLHGIRSGKLTEEQVNTLAEHAGQVGERRLLLDDRAAIGPGYIRARLRRWKRRHGPFALVIVDYLQLMRGEGDTREQEVSWLTRSLKAIAKELQVPIIALCQLNRESVHRSDKRPHLHDLRESGAIEQDADVVAMLYREDMHDDDTPNRGLCQVLIRKHRNGPLGEVTLRYLADFCRFENTRERFTTVGMAPVRSLKVSGYDAKMRAAGDAESA